VISNAGGMDLGSPDSYATVSHVISLFSKDHAAQAAQHRLSLDSRSGVFKICTGYHEIVAI
jgi:hypothetical protein